MTMTKRLRTLGVVTALVLAGIGLVSFIFVPSFLDLEDKIQKRSRMLQEYGALLQRKESLQAEWAKKKDYFNPGVSREETLNAWQKTLMAGAQKEALTIDKLEPAGIKEGEASIFISFQSPMKNFVRFLFHLMESDPLVKVRSFSMRQDDGVKNYSFELMLSKSFL